MAEIPVLTNGLEYRMNPNGNIVYMILKDPKGNVASDILKHYTPPLSHSQSVFSITTTSANRKEKKKMTTAKTSYSKTISIKELKELLLDNLNALWENDPALHTKHATSASLIPPIMVWGAPGLGKSTAVRELTQELGIGFIDVRLAQREPVDMRGLPVPDEKENSVKWLVSGEWPRDPNSRGIIMFDELTAADKTLQVAAYEFILDRRLGALYNVPDGWYIMAAGNRIEDRAVSCAMSSALANRFLHVEVAAEAASFLAWAKENNLHPAVTGFINFRPQLLFSQENEDLQRGWPSPRSWERVSTMLKIAEKNQRKSSLKYTIPGLIGQGAAAEFMAFYKNIYYMSDTVDIAECLKSGRTIPLPQKADLLHACCGAVAYQLKSTKDAKLFPVIAENFLKFVQSLPNDFAAMIMSDVESSLAGTKRSEIIKNHQLYASVQQKYKPESLFEL
ncbi:MAG: AAA family ATPase [Lentisphaeria bacterium]|nr:AAA family ATPase [Lentisphaeria bacterium]